MHGNIWLCTNLYFLVFENRRNESKFGVVVKSVGLGMGRPQFKSPLNHTCIHTKLVE